MVILKNVNRSRIKKLTVNYLNRAWGVKKRVIFKLKLKLRPNKSFDMSSFLVGREKRVYEHAGKGGLVRKSNRRMQFNYLEKVSSVFVRTTDVVERLHERIKLDKYRCVCFLQLKGLNNITYVNLNYLDVLLANWVSPLVVVHLSFIFLMDNNFKGKYRCIKKFKRKVRIGKRVRSDKSL